jgi:hypothetical protein
MEFIYFVVLWLNAFPVKSGISSTYSPRELLVRWKLDYKIALQSAPWNLLRETHDKPVPTNTMTPRTHKCIACGPTGKLHDGADPETPIVHSDAHARQNYKACE